MVRLLLVGILLVQQAACLADQALDFNVSLALGGNAKSGALSELRVDALSSTGGQVSVETLGGSPDVRFSFAILPGQRSSAYAPVGVGIRGESLTVRARINDAGWQSKMLPPTIVSSRVFSVGEQLTGSTGAIALSKSDLPQLLQSYESVFALAIDGNALAELNDNQLRALLDYAGSCGRLLLVDVATSAREIFAGRAACSGDYILAVNSPTDVATELQNLVDLTGRALPSSFQMQQLAKFTAGGNPSLATVSKFWLAYLIALLILLASSRKPAAIFGLAITATLLVVFIWPKEVSRNFVAWAEASFGDDVARYRSLERHVSYRQNQLSLPVDRYRNELANIVGEGYAIQWNTIDSTASAEWNAKPFQEFMRLATGSFAIEPSLSVHPGNEVVTVCNDSEHSSQSAYLHWKDSIFEIGPLGPGATWTNADKPAINLEPDLDGSLALLRSRAREYELAILTPLLLNDDDSRAWLIRFGDSPTLASTCAT